MNEWMHEYWFWIYSFFVVIHIRLISKWNKLIQKIRNNLKMFIKYRKLYIYPAIKQTATNNSFDFVMVFHFFIRMKAKAKAKMLGWSNHVSDNTVRQHLRLWNRCSMLMWHNDDIRNSEQAWLWLSRYFILVFIYILKQERNR